MTPGVIFQRGHYLVLHRHNFHKALYEKYAGVTLTSNINSNIVF